MVSAVLLSHTIRGTGFAPCPGSAVEAGSTWEAIVHVSQLGEDHDATAPICMEIGTIGLRSGAGQQESWCSDVTARIDFALCCRRYVARAESVGRSGRTADVTDRLDAGSDAGS